MRASAVAKTALATAAALLLLLRFPGDGSGGLLGKEGYGRSSQTALNRSAGAGLLSGAILLADESTVKRLVAPHLFAKMRVAPARMQTATQIPFSGEYWIRGWPTRQRPRDVAEHRASPLHFSFDTVDQSPIHMQAYQKLGVPLSLAGVHALEVGFTNRDPEPDTLGLRVSLRDASSKGSRWMNLAAMRVPPLESGAMRFVIPQGAAMQAFDEILLDFQLYQPRMHRSAKLTIDWFRLETGR